MTKLLFKTAVLALSVSFTASRASADNDVLYWMVDGSSAMSGASQSTVADFIGAYDAPSDSSFAARVRVTGPGISSGDDVFLQIYCPDGSGGYSLEDGDLGYYLGDTGSGYWGAGVPAGVPAPISTYSSGSPEYSFIVELGNIVWSADGETGNWTTLAQSTPSSYSSLGAFITSAGSLGTPQISAWAPTTFTTVPEPSGGLMMALGIALLALRRGSKA